MYMKLAQAADHIVAGSSGINLTFYSQFRDIRCIGARYEQQQHT